MKVKTLIEVLKNADPEADIFVSEDNVEHGTYKPLQVVARTEFVTAKHLYIDKPFAIFKKGDVPEGSVLEKLTGVVIE